MIMIVVRGNSSSELWSTTFGEEEFDVVNVVDSPSVFEISDADSVEKLFSMVVEGTVLIDDEGCLEKVDNDDDDDDGEELEF